mgnify:CR=1 FL=1
MYNPLTLLSSPFASGTKLQRRREDMNKLKWSELQFIDWRWDVDVDDDVIVDDDNC